MSWILAADTSSSLGSLALFKNKKLVASVDWLSEKNHSEALARETEKLLKTHNISFGEIDAYAMSVGPGSFTGVRVALNFIKGLAYAFQKPIYSVNSLLLLAAPALAHDQSVICLQAAFRNLIYTAAYFPPRPKIDSTPVEFISPSALTPENINLKYKTQMSSSFLVLGLAYSQFQSDFDPAFSRFFTRNSSFLDYPHAKSFEYIFSQFASAQKTSSWNDTLPLYIRASEAEEKLKNN